MAELTVPTNVNYLSDFKGFELPNGVFNKGITACGATTLAIEDEHKTIICSPRNNLIENKHEQHPNTLLVIGRIPEQKIIEYLNTEPLPKILVSYDSLPKVAKCIADKSGWRVVVDEFQYLLSDSSMKSEVEIRLLETLKQFSYVTYMSATPILKNYLDRISWLKGLPYLELKWLNIEKIKLIRQQSKRPIDAALEIVRSYQQGAYPKLNVNGEIVFSKECVIYLNSVNNIVNIIKQTGLQDYEVNVIVGNNEENDKQLAKVGVQRGRIPLKGEPHKMFTFCTSTAFAGCDFYSTCASSYVISDSKRINTTIDIATDLLQIAGRQRLSENPFRKHLTFVYNLNQDELTEEEFKKQLAEKYRLTYLEIEDANNIKDSTLRNKRIRDVTRLQKMLGYGESFTMYDEISDKFIVNEMASLNIELQYELQRHNYINGVVVRNQISATHYDVSSPVEYKIYEEQLRNTIRKESFVDRMKRYCEYKSGNCQFDLIASFYDEKYPELKLYYDELGGKRIKALGYKESVLKNEISNRQQKTRLCYEFRKIFKSGERCTTDYIREQMSEIYAKYGVSRKAVATHLREYGINLKPAKVVMSDCRRLNGYEFL